MYARASDRRSTFSHFFIHPGVDDLDDLRGCSRGAGAPGATNPASVKFYYVYVHLFYLEVKYLSRRTLTKRNRPFYVDCNNLTSRWKQY